MAKSKERRFTVHEARKADGCPTKFKTKDYSGVYESSTFFCSNEGTYSIMPC